MLIVYERSSNHPSLLREGEAVLHETNPGSSDEFEFKQKMALLAPIYSVMKYKLETRQGRKYRWTSLEFSDFQREIDAHLAAICGDSEAKESVLYTVYRGVQKRPGDSSLRLHVSRMWNSFCTEFNNVVQEWRRFTD